MQRRSQLFVDPFAVAIVYAGFEDKDEALAWLKRAERASDAHSESLFHYKDARP